MIRAQCYESGDIIVKGGGEEREADLGKSGASWSRRSWRLGRSVGAGRAEVLGGVSLETTLTLNVQNGYVTSGQDEERERERER